MRIKNQRIRRWLVCAVVGVVFLTAGLNAQAQQRGPWAPPYPGSVEGDCRGMEESRSFYLTRDPQSAVKEFYIRHRGAGGGTDSLEYAFGATEGAEFVKYSSSTFEVSSDDGVLIYRNSGRSDAVKTVLRKLEDLALEAPGTFSRAEYDRAVARYGDMAKIYPLSDERDRGGRRIPVDQLLLELCEAEYEQLLGDEPTDEAAVQAQFNALIAQGRFQDAAALMERYSSGVVGRYDKTRSREVVDLWLAFLEEMEHHAYPVVIYIGHRR